MRLPFVRALVAGLFIGITALLPSFVSAQAPLVLENRRDIKFGKFVPDQAAPGTVVLSPTSDTVTVTGGLINFGGTVRRARIRITGEPRAEVIVTLPTSITIRRGTSGDVMTVDTFTMDRTNPVKLNKNGIRNINIGATLRVGVNQRKGNYNDDNTFTVDVEYF